MSRGGDAGWAANVGQHSGDNGAFHDGGLILKFPDRCLGLFLGFQTQKIPTDAGGNAAPGAMAISQVLAGAPPAPGPGPSPGPAPSPTPSSAIYIERALINPRGPDPGSEVVVLANLATSAQTLTDWQLVDKNARATAINATIGPGESTLVALDGSGVQLGNNGGSLALQDSSGAQVDAVTYSAGDASVEDRYFRFRR